MYIVVVGGGRAGFHLSKLLHNNGHEVCVIERDSAKCDAIARELGIRVINGDGSEEPLMRSADVERAHCVVALTNDDHDNLVICQLAERQFKVERTFTQVNNPGNAELFQWLGVNMAVCPTSLLAGLIQNDVDLGLLGAVLPRSIGDLKMVQMQIGENAPAAGKRINEIDLPAECIIITILRENTAMVPRGSTVIQSGDQVMALCQPYRYEEVVRLLSGS